MALNKLKFDQVDTVGKRVFIHVDFKVHQDKKDTNIMTHTQRMDAALPTNNYCLETDSTSVVLALHLGRPTGSAVPKFSQDLVAGCFEGKLGKPGIFLQDYCGPDVEAEYASATPGGVFSLENVHYQVEEQGKGVDQDGNIKADKDKIEAFRASLAKLADVFCSDTLGTAHHPHSSLMGGGFHVKYMGFLGANKLDAFAMVLVNPARPMYITLGSAQISGMLQLMGEALDKGNIIIIGYGMACTFLNVLDKINIMSIGGGMVSIEVKAVNDPFMDWNYMVYQLQFDSVHKPLPGTVAVKKEGDKEFSLMHSSPTDSMDCTRPSAASEEATGAAAAAGAATGVAAAAAGPGRMPIAQGMFKAINVNKCTAVGGTFKFWVADWFALMNDKMGGNLDIIQDVGKYLIEVWKSSGMRMEGVQFIWCEHFLGELAEKYWLQMMDISRCSNLTRIKKCGMIMGRDKDGDLSSAQILYPIMQCTDIFALSADICQLGVDQRKVNMLARDYCDASGKKTKPIILSHHMLYGLSQGQAKMSKSNPDSAIFMEDTAVDVERKIMKAYCPKTPGERDSILSGMRSVSVDSKKMPPEIMAASGFHEDETDEIKVGDLLLAVNDEPIGECIGQLDKLLKQKPVTISVKTPGAVKKESSADDDNAIRLVKDDLENPILDYLKYIVMGADDSEPIEIDGRKYASAEEVQEAFLAGGYEKKGSVSKLQLKRIICDRVNVMLETSRRHFAENEEAKRLLALVESHKKDIKEGKVKPAKTVRCLKTVSLSGKKDCKHVAVVFAPRPPTVPSLSIDVVLSVLVALNQAAQTADAVALWCEDWASFCVNSCTSAKVEEALQLISTWYGLLVDSLKLIAPDLMDKKVEVLIQSQQLLKDPNTYWISAIDVGRTFKLDRIRASLADGETLNESSQVITTLTNVADLLALSAMRGITSLTVVPVPPLKATDGPAAVPTARVLSTNMHKSAAKYIAETILPKAKACGESIVVPEVAPVAEFNDVAFDVLVGDGEPAVNGKVKKFYCLAGDVDHNPCIDLLEKLDAAGRLRKATNGEFLVIKGSEKSGHPDDRIFNDSRSVREEFAKGEAAIHPGDLKASVAPVVRAVIGSLLQCKEDSFVKAHKDLANAAKDMAKAAKKIGKKK